MSNQNLPEDFPVIDRLFRRFQAVYGAQKVAVTYEGMKGDPEDVMIEVMLVWLKKLRRFHPLVIGRALDDVVDGGGQWPPSLADFTKACHDAEVRLKGERPMLALPSPSEVADPDSPVVQTALAELRRFVKARRMPA
jgi:hypothetical protein